jgi:hypothetical protein
MPVSLWLCYALEILVVSYSLEVTIDHQEFNLVVVLFLQVADLLVCFIKLSMAASGNGNLDNI